MNAYSFSRFALYSHRLSGDKLNAGEEYNDDKPVISIILSNGTPVEPENKNYVSMYVTMDVHSHRMRADDIIYYEVEMKKFNARDYRQLRQMDALMMYFTSGKITPKDWQKLIHVLPELAIARDKEELFMKDDDFFSDYLREKDAEKMYNTGINRAKREGIEIGTAKGIEVGRAEAKLDMVKSFLQQGVAVEVISAASGLQVEEIENLEQ